MGGHGYSKLNMIGFYKDNNDVTNTFEGDNTVLQQQTSKFIIDNVKNFKNFEVMYISFRFFLG
jgi:acyl-CoA oxidase